MDVSKKYVEMCEKATEIQELWQYDDGDFFLHRFTERNVDPRFTIDIGKEIASSLCCSCNVIDSYGSTRISEYNPKGENVWLPRQDQLQSLLPEGRRDLLNAERLLALLNDLRDFCDPFDRLGTMPLPVATREAEKDQKYVEQFVTMEQLWLAFVMEEKFQKIWNGEEWIIR